MAPEQDEDAGEDASQSASPCNFVAATLSVVDGSEAEAEVIGDVAEAEETVTGVGLEAELWEIKSAEFCTDSAGGVEATGVARARVFNFSIVAEASMAVKIHTAKITTKTLVSRSMIVSWWKEIENKIVC